MRPRRKRLGQAPLSTEIWRVGRSQHPHLITHKPTCDVEGRLLKTGMFLVQWMERKRTLLAVSEVLRLGGGVRVKVVMVGGRMSNISVSSSRGLTVAGGERLVWFRVCLNWSRELNMKSFSWL